MLNRVFICINPGTLELRFSNYWLIIKCVINSINLPCTHLCVFLSGQYAAKSNTKCGVHQSSVLGPALYSLYLLSLDIVRNHITYFIPVLVIEHLHISQSYFSRTDNIDVPITKSIIFSEGKHSERETLCFVEIPWFD